MTEEKIDKYYERTLINLTHVQSDMSWCPSTDCNYVFVFESGDTELKCPICGKHYCLNCRAAFHIGMTCVEFKITNTKSKEDE